MEALERMATLEHTEGDSGAGSTRPRKSKRADKKEESVAAVGMNTT